MDSGITGTHTNDPSGGCTPDCAECLKNCRESVTALHECDVRKVLIEKFRASFYARHDHTYSGVDLLTWLESVEFPCPCEKWRVALDELREYDTNWISKVRAEHRAIVASVQDCR